MRTVARSHSIDRPATRIVYLTAFAAFSIGLAASWRSAGGDRASADHQSAIESAGLLADLLATDEQCASNPATCLERLVDHPRTLAAAIWQNGDDRPTHVAARHEEARATLDQSVATVADWAAADTADWVTATVPLDSEKLRAATLGLVMMRPTGTATGAGVTMLLLLAALALVPAALANRYLRASLFRPLEWLACGIADDPRRPVTKRLLRRRDEIGAITAELVRRRRKARFWRKRCMRWMRDNEARITRETHDIRTQLNKTQREAERDALTGILNRRQLERRLDALFDTQRLAGEDLSIIMLDVDHFKHLNDTLGHAAGDALLAFAGELIRSHVRANDLAIRYGGDEFTLVLPGLSEERAVALAKRLVSLFAQRARSLGVTPAPTLSFGAAGLLNRKAKSPSELLALADKSLYESKRQSRPPTHHARTQHVN